MNFAEAISALREIDARRSLVIHLCHEVSHAHLATIYGFYFPCDAPKDQRGKLRDEMKEQIINRLELVYPGLRQQIVEAAIFSSDHFATMQGATGGDFTHGLIHADQMLGARALVPGSAHETPIPGLYLCGAACHPGPGVTFLPGAGCAAEIAKALGQRPVYAPAD